jgi:hypothetical protein
VAYHIRVQEKVIPKKFGIRTRETAKSDHPIVKGDLLKNCCGCGKIIDKELEELSVLWAENRGGFMRGHAWVARLRQVVSELQILVCIFQARKA